MKLRYFIIAILFALAAATAYLLRDVINDVVIVPLAYLWWRVGIYYRAVPEDTWLTLAVIVISVVAYASLAGGNRLEEEEDAEGAHLAQGPVEELMLRLLDAPRLFYYRWLVANQLARLAQVFLMQREGRPVQRGDGTFDAPGWTPPGDVEAYLRYGLRRSSVAGGAAKLHKTNPLHTVEYLEAEIGDHYDAN